MRYSLTARAAVGAMTLVLLFACGRNYSKQPFLERISRIDELIAQNSFELVMAEINQLVLVIEGRDRWLQVLKRAYKVSGGNGNYDFLYSIATLASKDLPGSEEISAFLVYALLRSGRYERANALTQDRLSGEKWKSLRNEVLLTGKENVNTENLMFQIINSRQPDLYKQAADLYQDARLYLDAALLYAKEGDLDTAFDLRSFYHLLYPIPSVYISYDSGNFQPGLEEVKSLPQVDLRQEEKLLVIDLLYNLGSRDAIENINTSLIRENPKISWIPYVNNAILLSKRGDYKDAYSSIQAGLVIFPENPELRLAGISIQHAMGRSDEAKKELSEFRQTTFSNVGVAILSYQLEKSPAYAKRLQSLLWELFLKEPDDVQNARYLASYLLHSRDFALLESMLLQAELSSGQMEWITFLSAVADVDRGSYEAAIEGFSSAFLLQERWESQYNVGVIRLRSGKFSESLDSFRNAEVILTADGGFRKEDLARIRLRIAEAIWKQGDREGALRETQFALDLEPDLSQARLFLKLLESPDY